MNSFAKTIMEQKYSHIKKDGSLESWEEIAYRVSKNVMKAVDAPKELRERVYKAILEMKFMPAGRYLYSSGRPFHQTQNCLALRAEDSREGWADLVNKATLALMTGAGIGVDYSNIRPNGKVIRRTGGTSTGSIALMQIVNDIGRGVMQGGSRRSAIWAGLKWDHGDVLEFIKIKDWSEDIIAAKGKDYNFPAPLDGTNISVILNDEFFDAFTNEKHKKHTLAYQVYWQVVESMCKTGEPAFSVDVGANSNETLRNACCEFTSEDDSDICNLGSINLANISNVEEFKEILEVAVSFLLAGTVYSDVPYSKVDQVRNKNRKIGVGLMGVHEFLLKKGKRYGEIESLLPYLEEYKKTDSLGKLWADKFDIKAPIKTRAIAPTGTIGILAETSTGLEPLFCVAYKRRYIKGNVINYQYVIDPTAKRLIDSGISPELIEDAYDLSHDIERRVKFQADLQGYVDMGISSTLNLPQWGSDTNNENTLHDFGNMLMKYLPKLRGITAYPDGARSGQPLTPVKYQTAISKIDQVFVEGADICSISGKGTCNG